MSIESILLVAFLVFPLLERLTRHLRERAARAPADPAAGVPAPVLVPPPPLRHPAGERLSAGERVRVARMIQAEAVTPSSAARPRQRVRHGLALHEGRSDLRRAVVLMTVLGPCKALENEPRP